MGAPLLDHHRRSSPARRRLQALAEQQPTTASSSSSSGAYASHGATLPSSLQGWASACLGVQHAQHFHSAAAASAAAAAEPEPVPHAAWEDQAADLSSAQLTPRQVVEMLDRYIVGQGAAKKAVANALRNRWRRHKVPSPLREEIHPKNLLMIGPTGCGKTEIARRLAKLANAPFVKVEATKFTEVGFHGRDVDQIIRDLVDNAIIMMRQVRWGGV